MGGCLATVEVERELETHQHLPPKAVTHLLMRRGRCEH